MVGECRPNGDRVHHHRFRSDYGARGYETLAKVHNNRKEYEPIQRYRHRDRDSLWSKEPQWYQGALPHVSQCSHALIRWAKRPASKPPIHICQSAADEVEKSGGVRVIQTPLQPNRALFRDLHLETKPDLRVDTMIDTRRRQANGSWEGDLGPYLSSFETSPHWTIFATLSWPQPQKCSVSSSRCEKLFSLICRDLRNHFSRQQVSLINSKNG